MPRKGKNTTFHGKSAHSHDHETAVSKAGQKRFSRSRTPQAWLLQAGTTRLVDALWARRCGLVDGGPEVGLSAVCAWCGVKKKG
jgi:hypothetical protein